VLEVRDRAQLIVLSYETGLVKVHPNGPGVEGGSNTRADRIREIPEFR